MLQLKHVISKVKLKTFFPYTSIFTNTWNTSSYSSSSSSLSPLPKSSFPITQNDVASTFKTWFQNHHLYHDPLLLRIYQILSSNDNFSASLTSLNLPITTSFVLRVLHYGDDNNYILPCLRFFDWVGHQPGFYHTQPTFTAIFRILARAKLMPIVIEFLETFGKRVFDHKVCFIDLLVVGYAIAGKPEIALNVFGKMRFQGLDLDIVGYHILLGALAKDNYFNSFDVILNQIRSKGYATRVTDTIVVKFLCNQGRLDEAENYLIGLLDSGKKLHGSEVGFLVVSLCERKKVEHAVELVKEFRNSGLNLFEHAYGDCIKGLVKGGRFDEALEFFRQKRESEGYVPRWYRYNMLICRLLRESRLQEVYDLLMDMKESCIPPDMVTMSVVLCFLCKAGMVNAALQLYESRSQFGLNPNNLAYKYLILNLCWDGSVKEAYSVLKTFIGNGLFPDTQTFTTLANALCRECMVDEMKELMHLAWERNFTPSHITYDKFISALCQAGRLEDSYLVHGDHNNATARLSYGRMIKSFIKFKRGDIAARLLVKMKEKNFELTRIWCTAVIGSLLDMENPKSRVFNLLDMLTHGKPDAKIFNFFIDGAVHANNTELSREVYELMLRNNIAPSSSSQRLVLIGYLKSGKISDALNFFHSLRRQGTVSKKVYQSIIFALCKSCKADIAHDFLFQMFKAGLNPSIECFEILVQTLCSLERYHEAINLVHVYIKMGRRLTNFLGNILLSHSLISPDIYHACVRLRGAKEEECSPMSTLSYIIGAFSRCLRVNPSVEELEKLISMCFPLDFYTYNQLLRRVTQYDMNQACELFNRIRQRGYEPNDWTYNIMVSGFSNHGRNDEAKQWVEEMHQKGFYPRENTKRNVQKGILSNREY